MLTPQTSDLKSQSRIALCGHVGIRDKERKKFRDPPCPKSIFRVSKRGFGLNRGQKHNLVLERTSDLERPGQ